jgi:3-oxoadipate enol-lactonase
MEDAMIETPRAQGLLQTFEAGSGPSLVLFHSLLADRTSFAGVTDELARHFRLVVVSLPGFGASPSVDGGLAAVADRMAEAVGELAGPVTVLGNGYGGFVALCMVQRHPGLVARLVLADAGACFSEPGRAAFRGMAMGAAAKGLDGIADIAMRRLFAPDFHAANPDLVAQRRTVFLDTDPHVVIAACEALAGMDLRPGLPAVTIPVLAVVGLQDEATPPAMSREVVALLPQARLIELDGLAHVPQLQDPTRFLDAVLPFLRGA